MKNFSVSKGLSLAFTLYLHVRAIKLFGHYNLTVGRFCRTWWKFLVWHCSMTNCYFQFWSLISDFSAQVCLEQIWIFFGWTLNRHDSTCINLDCKQVCHFGGRVLRIVDFSPFSPLISLVPGSPRRTLWWDHHEA